MSLGIIRIIFNVNESHGESVWGSSDDSTHSHPSLFRRSVSLSDSGASLDVLFAAADMTIALAGINEDVDN